MLTVGRLFAWRRPSIALGWLLLIIALLVGTQGLAGFVSAELPYTALAVATWLLWWGRENQWNWLPPPILLVTQVPLRSPTGGLPSRRWRGFSRLTIVLGLLACMEAMSHGAKVGRGLPNPTYAHPHTAGPDLLDAVRQTLQPTAVGLWARENPR
jgi:hypothetical protein